MKQPHARGVVRCGSANGALAAPAAGFAVLAGVFAILAACSSAPTHLFTLYAVPPAVPAAVGGTYAGPPLRVDAVHMPPSLDRIEMVGNLGRGELDISDVNHWSAPLGQEARQALSADLIARLPAGKVIFPHLAKPDGALGITVDILEFKADGSGASLQASWVTGPPSPATAVQSTVPFRTEQVRTDRSVIGAAATAQALSDLLGELADRIAADLVLPNRP